MIKKLTFTQKIYRCRDCGRLCDYDTSIDVEYSQCCLSRTNQETFTIKDKHLTRDSKGRFVKKPKSLFKEVWTTYDLDWCGDCGMLQPLGHQHISPSPQDQSQQDKQLAKSIYTLSTLAYPIYPTLEAAIKQIKSWKKEGTLEEGTKILKVSAVYEV